MTESDVLTPEDVQRDYRIPLSTQRRERSLGTFAAHYRVGRRIYYRRKTIESWIADQERRAKAEVVGVDD